ncbi:hypothetical protein [Thalassovita sp.]|uniref:hypothetical protein n=1 Tax=Thalassovita sp. TaxID=1979401 RepID=UPI003B5AF4DD
MIEFRPLADDEPALSFSPLLRGVLKTFAYIQEHGSIGLTPSKAFKRNFVHWAAAKFDWPGYTEADLFAVNKVLNEHDFIPLGDIHFLLTTLKMGRHYKGNFKLTKSGAELTHHPGRLFGIITPFYLFEIDHSGWSRTPDQTLPGNWDVFLNVLNVETEDGASGAYLRQILFGEPDPSAFPRYDEMMGSLYTQILRPLVWTGLLQETRPNKSFRTQDSLFTKTPLWKVALKLETDSMVRSATRH